MKNTFLLIIGLIYLTSIGCKDDPVKVVLEGSAFEYLSFGHFFGLCQGEECVEIFRIDDTGIAEDTTDIYPSRTEPYQGHFVLIEDIDFTAFESLVTTFPEGFLNEEENVFGCPDCADQGGFYIEISKVDGTKGFWILDTNNSSVPSYAHDYMDTIYDAIRLIND